MASVKLYTEWTIKAIKAFELGSQGFTQRDLVSFQMGIRCTNLDCGIKWLDWAAGRARLGRAHGRLAVQNLAVQVGQVDRVVVDDAQESDPGGR